MKKLLVLILVLGIATASFAVDKLSIRKFGGLNTRTNSFELQDSESPDMSNFTLDEAGSLTRRDLFQRYNTTSIGNISFTNLYKFYTSADAGYMILSGGTKLYKATGGAITDISNATSVITPNSQWAFESFTDGTNELCFAANNDDVLQSSNGTANFADEGGYPATNCNILKKHKSRLWAAGSKTYPYRIYYSSLSDGDDWTTTGGSMDLSSYEKIVALEVLSDTLFIFTRTSIYALLGDTPQEFAIQKTRSTVGTHAIKSVVLGNKLIYFLNKSGVFVFDGDESVNISETIQPTIDAISNTYIGTSASLFDKRGRLWVSYTSQGGSFNDRILVYDTVLKQWYPLDNVNFSAFFKTEGGADKGEIFATCSNSVGNLWQLQSSSSIESIVYSTETQLLTGTTFNTVVSSDPGVSLTIGGNDSYTKLLAHFNGTDGGTYTPAETGQVITYVNTAVLDTSIRKFNSASVIFNGVNDYISVPDSADYDFGTGNFTIDYWVYPTRAFAADYQGHVASCSFGGGIGWMAQQIITTGAVRLYDPAAGTLVTSNNQLLTINQWNHVAIVRKGLGATDLNIYINGVAGNAPQTGNIAINGTADVLVSGRAYSDSPQYFLGGNIDELRISKGIARWTSNFTPPNVEYYGIYTGFSGTLTSANLQINASGQASLGDISWQEYLPSNTDIQFTTRTGVTDDNVYWNGWQTWVSSNVVTMNSVTDATVWMPLTGSNVLFSAGKPTTAQTRNINTYETWDTVSANCVQFTTLGAVSTNKYCDTTVPEVNLTNDKFVGFWLKSPSTGNSVQLAIGETTGNVTAYTTANTVMQNTWEFHYWPIANYTQTDIDSIKFMRLTYLGNTAGNVYLGDVSAYDFLDNDETITSTPNDWIQYRAILGSTNYSTPRLLLAAGYVIKLSYSSTAGASETSLNSYWTSKPFDGGDSSKNKLWQWVSMNVESQNPTTGHTVTLTYNTDDGRQTGTVSKTVDVTGRTTNLKFYLPTGVYGRNCSFKFEDNDLDDQLKVKNMEVFVSPEGNS